MRDELDRCPCCGSSLDVWIESTAKYHNIVKCNACGFDDGIVCEDREFAVDMWNSIPRKWHMWRHRPWMEQTAKAILHAQEKGNPVDVKEIIDGILDTGIKNENPNT